MDLEGEGGGAEDLQAEGQTELNKQLQKIKGWWFDFIGLKGG